MRKLTIAAVLASIAALPAMAAAEKLNSEISIHSAPFSQDRIYGVVQAPKHKCENNRRVILLFDGASKARGGYGAVDETTTNGLGEYEFEIGKEKRGNPFAPGDYKVRTPRKEVRGNNVCARATSRTITIEGF
jgi:hypothetical protein